MASNDPTNNFIWPLGRLQEDQLPDDIRTAVEQFLPSGQQASQPQLVSPQEPTAAASTTSSTTDMGHIINMGGENVPATGEEEFPNFFKFLNFFFLTVRRFGI